MLNNLVNISTFLYLIFDANKEDVINGEISIHQFFSDAYGVKGSACQHLTYKYQVLNTEI